MLSRLIVRNYAIIDAVELDLSDQLTIITGETGAGKSILVGALSFILGERADTKVLYDKEQKCIVEGHFDISRQTGLDNRKPFLDFFQINNLDYEDITIVRREINQQGKSRAFINDTPVNLATLKELGDQLVDIHSQHQSLQLSESSFHLSVIDAFAQHQALLQSYQNHYKTYKETLESLQILIGKNENATSESDYLQFQFNELNESNLDEHEQETLEDEFNILTNAEEIKKTINEVNSQLMQNEISVYNILSSITQSLGSIKSKHPEIAKLYERIDSSAVELKDISEEMEKIEANTMLDEQRAEDIEARLNTIYGLEKKHRVNSIADLLSLKEKIEAELSSFSSLSEEIEKLEHDSEAQKTALLKLAKEISGNRKSQVPIFKKAVNELIKEVGMTYGMIEVEHKIDENEMGATGIDRMHFLFSPDKGKTYLEIHKIASGGELSRLMLSIKSLITGLVKLPTIIFDEIDTGISGEIAIKVGKVLEGLSKNHQVVCITHSPHLASLGEKHYYVYKELSDQRTYTRIKLIEGEERIVEIAKMLGGDQPSSVAIENAKELLT
ncbi:MAG: DNA repair protein RecN [Bacteroidetes bacterium]|nr:DNA repair protein RecN [Bacteroidota bacterium]